MAFQFVPPFVEGDKQTNPETGVEYIFTDGAWRPLGPKIEDQFDELDERYLVKTGDTMTGALAIEQSPFSLQKADGTQIFEIKPNFLKHSQTAILITMTLH